MPNLSPTVYNQIKHNSQLVTALPLCYLYCCKDFISHSLSRSFFLRCVLLVRSPNGAAFSKFIFKTFMIVLRNIIHDLKVFIHPHVFETSLNIYITGHVTVIHCSWLLGCHILPLINPWHSNSHTLHIKQVGDDQPYTHHSLVWETVSEPESICIKTVVCKFYKECLTWMSRELF